MFTWTKYPLDGNFTYVSVIPGKHLLSGKDTKRHGSLQEGR